jgi:hypothetical protein
MGAALESKSTCWKPRVNSPSLILAAEKGEEVPIAHNGLLRACFRIGHLEIQPRGAVWFHARGISTSLS